MKSSKNTDSKKLFRRFYEISILKTALELTKSKIGGWLFIEGQPKLKK
jgi:hypothetical protein